MGECFRITGGMPSPPIALEGSNEARPMNVSLREMLTEEREPSGQKELSN